MKRIILLSAILLGTLSFSYAQETGKIRGGIDVGYAAPLSGSGGGLLLAVELKYNLKDNMNVGLRYSAAGLVKTVSGLEDDSEEVDAELATNSAILGTFDYYFSSGNSKFAPFVGAGAGLFTLSSLSFSADVAAADFGFGSENKFGGIVRTGFELGKLRLTAQCNLIPKSTYEDGASVSTDLDIERTEYEVKNSYYGISLGFYIGGGKWKK